MTELQLLYGISLLLFCSLFLLIGLTVGWLGAERYVAFLTHTRHTYENLFDKNPHPEIYDEDGKINREDYMSITFDPGFDPADFDSEDILLEEDED